MLGVRCQVFSVGFLVFAVTKIAGIECFVAQESPSFLPMRKSVLARKSARSADVDMAVTERRSNEKMFGCLGLMR